MSAYCRGLSAGGARRPSHIRRRPTMGDVTYLGLDVHRETTAVALLRPGVVEPDHRVIPTTVEAYRRPVTRLGGCGSCVASPPWRPPSCVSKCVTSAGFAGPARLWLSPVWFPASILPENVPRGGRSQGPATPMRAGSSSKPPGPTGIAPPSAIRGTLETTSGSPRARRLSESQSVLQQCGCRAGVVNAHVCFCYGQHTTRV